MIQLTSPAARSVWTLIGVVAALTLIGCTTTSSAKWDDRVGTYTWDEAVAELGEPTRVSNLAGGVKVGEWITTRGLTGPTENPPPLYTRDEIITPNETRGWSAPDKVLRLMFTPDGKLLDWKRNY
ncbi:MAG: hypothetical protein MUC91_00790 [Verrucomicrobia bacterium]|jgi:hypothetical protein|nr:hypothetical protein [Verrucomicrobiota bacterium]